MTTVKNTILLISAALVTSATTIGTATALFGHDPDIIIRLTTVSYILVTGSIGLFFVGLAYPKPEGKTISSATLASNSEK